MAKCCFVVATSLVLCGCAEVSPDGTGAQPLNAIVLEIVKAEEHLGHSTLADGTHAAWYDGSTARIVPSGEAFVLWWMNEINPFRFEDGQTYTVWFTGVIGDGVMGYEGKCLRIRQIVKVERKSK